MSITIKNVVLYLAFAIFISIACKAEWSEPTFIYWGNTPDFEVDRNTGYLHIVCVGQYGPARYVRLDSTGTVLIAEDIPNTSHERGRGIWGPTIAVDYAGTPHVCYRGPSTGDSQYAIYYTYRTSSGWTAGEKIFDEVGRGTMVRMVIDHQNRIHVIRSAKVDYLKSPLVSIDYKRLVNGSVVFSQTVTDASKEYRFDSRAELAVSPVITDNNIHLVLGCPEPQDKTHPEAEGSKVTYFLNSSGNSSFVKTANIVSPANSIVGGQHAYRTGGPDLALDLNSNIHFLYGAANDSSIGGTNAIRYVRYENGSMKRNVCVTVQGEVQNWPSGPPNYGLGSIACTDDGLNIAS